MKTKQEVVCSISRLVLTSLLLGCKLSARARCISIEILTAHFPGLKDSRVNRTISPAQPIGGQSEVRRGAGQPMIGGVSLSLKCGLTIRKSPDVLKTTVTFQ